MPKKFPSTKMKPRKKRKKPKYRVIQTHHLWYGEGAETVKLYQGEHWMITKLDRKFRNSTTKRYSLGFLKALAAFYHLYGDNALDLENMEEENGN